MSMSVTEIADAIRQAGTDRARSSELMASLYTESIELSHVPPRPGDGPIPSSRLVELAGQEVQAVERALPDVTVHRPTVTVEGQRIRVRGRIEGTAANGVPLSSPRIPSSPWPTAGSLPCAPKWILRKQARGPGAPRGRSRCLVGAAHIVLSRPGSATGRTTRHWIL